MSAIHAGLAAIAHGLNLPGGGEEGLEIGRIARCVESAQQLEAHILMEVAHAAHPVVVGIDLRHLIDEGLTD